MSKWLITGGAGFVASHFIDLLLEKGDEVWITIRWNEDLSRIKHCIEKVNVLEADLTDYISILSAIEKSKPDFVSHLAAESYVNSSYIRPQSTLMATGGGTLNILESIKYLKEKDNTFDPVVHICSSSEVYGLVENNDIPIKESQPFNPSNPYAACKVLTDMLALMYWNNYKIKTIRTRMFTHIGPRRTMMSAECAFAKQIAEFEKIELHSLPSQDIPHERYFLYHGNLNSIRTWADVRDAVKAYYVLVRKGKPGEVYNIGGNTTKSIGEMLDFLISLSPLKDKIIKQEDPKLLRPYDVTLQIPDISKFEKDTGWKAEIPFEKTMEDLLNWWRKNV